MYITRLGPADRAAARQLFGMMADVFEEAAAPLSDAYLERLLARPDFWVMSAAIGGEPVGGITAHALPLTRREEHELFIYDLAVRPDQQRKGIGRALIEALVEAAAKSGIRVLFVPADNEDQHALDFYRAVGGSALAVTHFTFERG